MRRIALTALALALPATAHAKPDPCNTRACNERVARKQCSQTKPRACVERAILTYRLTGWEAAWMRRASGVRERLEPPCG